MVVLGGRRERDLLAMETGSGCFFLLGSIALPGGLCGGVAVVGVVGESGGAWVVVGCILGAGLG